MNIGITVAGQTMKLAQEPQPVIVAGSKEFVKLKFEMSHDWDWLAKRCLFQQGDLLMNVPVEETDSECYVWLPKEIDGGNVSISMTGTGSEAETCTNEMKLWITGNKLTAEAEQ